MSGAGGGLLAGNVGVALGALVWVALLGVAAWSGWSLWQAVRPLRAEAPATVEAWTPAQVSARRAATGLALAGGARKVEARSPFYPPKPPEVPKPAIPPRYGGPALVGVAANAVYFADGKKIGLGQSEGGIEVVSISAPWSVRLRWSGGEFDVTLIERQPIRFDQSTMMKDTLFKPAAP